MAKVHVVMVNGAFPTIGVSLEIEILSVSLINLHDV